jgi:hypothetical protein
MQDVGPIAELLKKSHADMIASCHEIPENRWRSSPGNGAWSAAEIVVHLTMVEDKVASTMEKMLREAPVPVKWWKRFHLPVSLAENRGIKRKTPIPLDASLVKEKAEALEKLNQRRNHSMALLLANGRRDLSGYRFSHPFLGSLNFYDWFRMLGHHQVRHTKQIREIVESFRK